MASRRLSHEEGHKRKFLAIIDDTPECDRAVMYAGMRAERTGGALLLCYVVAPADFQHWIGVEEIMKAEARDEADIHLSRFAQLARERANIDAELVIREGKTIDEIIKLIDEDRDVSVLVLAAGENKDGPGPLVSSITGRSADFPIPVVVVPCTMSDEEIDAVA